MMVQSRDHWRNHCHYLCNMVCNFSFNSLVQLVNARCNLHHCASGWLQRSPGNFHVETLCRTRNSLDIKRILSTSVPMVATYQHRFVFAGAVSPLNGVTKKIMEKSEPRKTCKNSNIVNQCAHDFICARSSTRNANRLKPLMNSGAGTQSHHERQTCTARYLDAKGMSHRRFHQPYAWNQQNIEKWWHCFQTLFHVNRTGMPLYLNHLMWVHG